METRIGGSVTLAWLRQRLGISQGQLAREIGTTQPSVLKIERSTDPQTSTLERYVEGLNSLVSQSVQLEICIVVDGQRLIVEIPYDEGETMNATETKSHTDWRLRAWDDPVLEQRWLTEGVIAMSNDEVGDLSDWPGDDALRRHLEAELTKRGDARSNQAYGTFVRYWRSFRLDMQPGDLVAVPLVGRRVAIGEIVGDYEYRPGEPDRRMRHVRRVRWIRESERSALDDRLRKVVNAPGTICQIRHGHLSAEP